MDKTIRWSYIPYKLNSYSLEQIARDILKKDTMVSHEIETICLFGDHKDM